MIAYVGKTYSWKKFLMEASLKDQINFEKYSYVSLFGLNTLDAFKYHIFENIVGREMVGSEANIETFKTNTSSLLDSLGRQSIKLFKGAPLVKSFGAAIETISFMSVNKVIICIDDLERKGSGLDVKDVLGLISLLKEQKKCKIVLLLNDGEEGMGDYEKYREKVIDVELEFAPNPEECANIAYSDSTLHYDRLTELVVGLEIRNIRILKKIERLIELALPSVSEFEPEITDQVIHSLTLYCWSYFCSKTNSKIPPLGFITDIGYKLLGLGDKELDDQQQGWVTSLKAYGYRVTDELDFVLAQMVKTGFAVESDIKKYASIKNQEIITSKRESSFSEAWKLYHDSFDNNGDEVVNALYESFKENFMFITPTNLNGTVTLFRELGENEKATEIIDLYISERGEEKQLFNMAENNVFGDIRDEEIVAKFNAFYDSSIISESPKQVLDRIAGKNGWNDGDMDILSGASEEELYKLFKSETGRSLRAFVTTCLRFGKLSNATAQQKTILKNSKAALLKIASESEINRRRVKQFGVDVKNN